MSGLRVGAEPGRRFPQRRSGAGGEPGPRLGVVPHACAAPNRSAIARSQPQYLPDLPAVLVRRAGRVLAVAAAHGRRRLVLGAWGCGVFGNDPATVAAAFATALRHSPWFDQVAFAVLDREPTTPTPAAFTRALMPMLRELPATTP